jgi:signal transduction histidine kinase
MNGLALPRPDRLSPAQRFMLGSLVILVVGMTAVGAWVSRQIEDGVVHRTAANTALYVDSLIAPPLQDLADAAWLSPEAVDRLDWLLEDTPLGREVAVFQVWDSDGHIVYSTEPALVGHQAPVEGDLAVAFAGGVAASLGELEGEDRLPADEVPSDLIEIYSPVRSGGTNEIIAVAEFYYAADALQQDIASAQRRSWLVVGGATVIIYVLLATFIVRVSNTVRRQQVALANQVTRLTELLHQNDELHARVRGAAARTAALNERFLRRFSVELHDGPAQDISLALLRLDNVAARAAGSLADGDRTAIERELEVIQTSLRRSLQEVRATASGLLLPHLGSLTVAQTIEHVVRGHQRRTGVAPRLDLRDLPERAPLAVKIALYRIVQEALNNAWRHAPGAAVSISLTGTDGGLRLEIADDGPGFDAAAMNGAEDQLGLFGMRERAESLGGEFRLTSGPGDGTRLTATLPFATAEAGDDGYAADRDH